MEVMMRSPVDPSVKLTLQTNRDFRFIYAAISLGATCVAVCLWFWMVFRGGDFKDILLKILILGLLLVIGTGSTWAVILEERFSITFDKVHACVLKKTSVFISKTTVYPFVDVVEVKMEEIWDDEREKALYRICLWLIGNKSVPITSFNTNKDKMENICGQIQSFLSPPLKKV
jgi:hypothetical protein